jgi:hypothetical protein
MRTKIKYTERSPLQNPATPCSSIQSKAQVNVACMAMTRDVHLKFDQKAEEDTNGPIRERLAGDLLAE